MKSEGYGGHRASTHSLEEALDAAVESINDPQALSKGVADRLCHIKDHEVIQRQNRRLIQLERALSNLRDATGEGPPETDEEGIELFLRALQITPREYEVLQAVGLGEHTIAEVGRQLFMAESTVKAHMTALHTKLGVHNRTQMALKALRLGLISLD